MYLKSVLYGYFNDSKVEGKKCDLKAFIPKNFEIIKRNFTDLKYWYIFPSPATSILSAPVIGAGWAHSF